MAAGGMNPAAPISQSLRTAPTPDCHASLPRWLAMTALSAPVAELDDRAGALALLHLLLDLGCFDGARVVDAGLAGREAEAAQEGDLGAVVEGHALADAAAAVVAQPGAGPAQQRLAQLIDDGGGGEGGVGDAPPGRLPAPAGGGERGG